MTMLRNVGVRKAGNALFLRWPSARMLCRPSTSSAMISHARHSHMSATHRRRDDATRHKNSVLKYSKHIKQKGSAHGRHAQSRLHLLPLLQRLSSSYSSSLDAEAGHQDSRPLGGQEKKKIVWPALKWHFHLQGQLNTKFKILIFPLNCRIFYQLRLFWCKSFSFGDGVYMSAFSWR